MEQAPHEPARAPILRRDLQFRPLAAGRVFIYHPRAASQILDARAGAALRLCQGQPLAEMMPQVCATLQADCTAEEWAGFLDSVASFGFFEGRPKRHPRVRLFDPGPVVDALARARWLFTAPAAVLLFALLAAGLAMIAARWDFFVAEVARVTGAYPLLAVALFYFCFLPVGLLHELAHGIVCRRFGGEVVEVGLRKDSANLYVLSNTAPLGEPRMRILYLAGGPFLDMLVLFLLAGAWTLWPNTLTLMLLLPQALFFLVFSYAMEAGSDLSRIVAEWTGRRESAGRLAFLKEFFQKRPSSAVEWKRAAVYWASMALQTAAAVFLVWTFREPVPVTLWPGRVAEIPFWPPLLYLLYRLLRRGLMNAAEWAARRRATR